MKAMAEVKAKVARAQEQAKQRAQAEQNDGPPPARASRSAKVVRLPVWPGQCRGVPNVALRSALFGAIKKGARPYLECQEIHAQDGITIRYTGTRLDQVDLDVWETTLHLTREQSLGNDCRLTAYQLLKLMGKADTGGNRDVLHKRLMRLKATALEVKVGRYSYVGSLVDEVFKDEVSREYVIRLNPKLRTLFEHDQFTQVDWAVRQALDGKPLAQWLHGYFASHAKPFPVKVATLHKLCGSGSVRMDHFRQDLRKALDAVAEACKAHEQPFSYGLAGDDLVHTEKKPTGTQRRHLTKKQTKPEKTPS